jgi:drug/metabolite transporter (DMT)-like permease
MADLALAAIMAVWGSSFAILRGLMGRDAASPMALVAVRMALASGLLVGFMLLTARGRAQLRALRGQLLFDGLAAGASLGLGFLLQIEGLQRTSASRSGFLTGLLVVLVPILEFAFLRKRPRALSVVALLIAFAGMTVLSAPWADSSAATALGDGLTVACAVFNAGQIVILGRVAPRHPVLPLLLLQLVATGAMAAAAGPFVEVQRFSGEARLWGALLYLALFATLLAFGIQVWAQKILSPVRVALLGALEPVFAAVWAALLLGERLSGHELAGGALIIAGVLVGEAGPLLRRNPPPAGY